MKIMLQAATRIPALCIIFLLVSCSAPMRSEKLDIRTAQGLAHFTVEIADTTEAEEQGLMFRRSLAPDHGMLFPLDPPRAVAMWMKNTLIPLDMLFLKPDGTIERIQENAVPGSLLYILSEKPVAAVLELPGGTASRLGIHPGDRVISPRYSQ